MPTCPVCQNIELIATDNYCAICGTNLEWSPLVKLLSCDKKVRKEDIAIFLEVDERTARKRIEDLRPEFPIDANSESAGYKIATRLSDRYENRLTMAQTFSRIRALQRDLAQLMIFEELCVKGMVK